MWRPLHKGRWIRLANLSVVPRLESSSNVTAISDVANADSQGYPAMSKGRQPIGYCNFKAGQVGGMMEGSWGPFYNVGLVSRHVALRPNIIKVPSKQMRPKCNEHTSNIQYLEDI